MDVGHSECIIFIAFKTREQVEGESFIYSFDMSQYNTISDTHVCLSSFRNEKQNKTFGRQLGFKFQYFSVEKEKRQNKSVNGMRGH